MATQEAFLGETMQEWAQNMRNGYTRAFIMFALHETGVFDLLKGHQRSPSANASHALNSPRRGRSTNTC